MKKKNKIFNSIKNIPKLLLVYYILVILFGIYNLFMGIFYYHPLEKGIILTTNHWMTVFIQIPLFLILFILSIVIIIYTLKKRLSKLNLIYPIYFLILWIITPIISYSILILYLPIMSFFILDLLVRFYIIFYIFDIIFPIYIINRLRKDTKKVNK